MRERMARDTKLAAQAQWDAHVAENADEVGKLIDAALRGNETVQ